MNFKKIRNIANYDLHFKSNKHSKCILSKIHSLRTTCDTSEPLKAIETQMTVKYQKGET